MSFTFEKLNVYQKSVDFADLVTGMTGGFPRGFGYLADQLNRASLSIAANIAEGNGRFTKADRRNFFGIARGSVQECVPLLEIARRRGLPAKYGKGLDQLPDEILDLFKESFVRELERTELNRALKIVIAGLSTIAAEAGEGLPAVDEYLELIVENWEGIG